MLNTSLIMLTKHMLINALLTGGPLVTPTVAFTIVNGIAREDGSNHSYLVTGHVKGHMGMQTVCVRMLD